MFFKGSGRFLKNMVLEFFTPAGRIHDALQSWELVLDNMLERILNNEIIRPAACRYFFLWRMIGT